jgi:serine/threonine-protein kinase PpkA
MIARRLLLSATVALALAIGLGAPAADAQQQRRPLLIEGKQNLYQRVIARPGAQMTAEPRPGAGTAVPGFSVFYVYERKDGFALVGSGSDGQTAGWLPVERVIDWKQTMVLAFTNPAGRERGMFFKDAETARRLWLGGADRASEAQKLRAEAAAGADGPVIALEPENHVDITRQFYLLPVLAATPVENERAERALLLDVVSAPAEKPPQLAADPSALRDYKGAIVFVVDTTISMGPYIERTREAIRRVVQRIGDTAVRDNFRFGMVAFRDHMGNDPRLEYVTRLVSTPDFAQAPDAVVAQLGAATEAKASNEGFDEDALAGIKVALEKVSWREFGGRFIILITDAGTREASDPLSETKLGPREMNALARAEANQVAIYAVHVRTPEGRNNHAKAEKQYRELTQFGGTDPLYYPIQDGNVERFGSTIDRLTDALLTSVAQAVGRPIGGMAPPQSAEERRIAAQAEIVGNAMRLSYLGRVRREAAPDVVRSVILSEDAADPVPEKRPVEPRILLTRNQLSDLAQTLRGVMEAGNAARLAPDTWFSRIRAATAASTRDPRRMAEFQRLGGAFGEYLEDLPYQSAIMEITQQEWVAMGAGRRREILNDIEAKLRLYEEFNRQPSLWVSFDGGKDPGEAMYPLPLDALP